MDTDLPLADELADVFAGATRMLLSEDTVDGGLKLITRAAALAVDGSIGAGVTLVDSHGCPASTATTGPAVADADALQYELGQGPCLSAWAMGTPVGVEDLGSDMRWPEWAMGVLPLGIRACLSAPLLAGDLVFGAVKVYWDKPVHITQATVDLLELFAAQAAVFLGNVQTRERIKILSAELKAALAQRDLIGMAKGITMVRHGLREEDAMHVLISRARFEGKTLRVVAQEILEDPPPSGG
jgi:GAF domain-containing protein